MGKHNFARDHHLEGRSRSLAGFLSKNAYFVEQYCHRNSLNVDDGKFPLACGQSQPRFALHKGHTKVMGLTGNRGIVPFRIERLDDTSLIGFSQAP